LACLHEKEDQEEEEIGLAWRNHRYGDYHIQVKVYKHPSKLGMRKGRISKLEIRTKTGKVVARYNRGWDIRPSKNIHRTIVNWVLDRYKGRKK